MNHHDIPMNSGYLQHLSSAAEKHAWAIIERLSTKYVAFVVILILAVCIHMGQYQTGTIYEPNSMELSPVSHPKI